LDYQNEGNTVEQYKKAYDSLKSLLETPVEVSHAPPASMQTVKHQIEGQRQRPMDDGPNDWQIGILLNRNDSWQMLLQMHYMERAPPGPRGKKRSVEGSEESTITVKTRNPRTCRTCHKTDCPGNFMSRPCKYKAVNLGFTGTI
jgi:hypothetical protein